MDNTGDEDGLSPSFPVAPDADLGLDDNYEEDEFYGLGPDPSQETFTSQAEGDWYLDPQDRRAARMVATSATVEEWTDVPVSRVGEEVIFNLDSATIKAWEDAQEEIIHLRSHLHEMCNIDPTRQLKLGHLVNLCFGPASDFASAFRNEMNMSQDDFMRFLGNICLQMSYLESASGLTEKYSELTEACLMTEREYLDTWKKMANDGKVSSRKFLGSSRREEPLWKICEMAANKFLRAVAVADRDGDLSIALDDDKIWCESNGENAIDDFMIRRVRHNADNRKGMISHTAVSALTLVLLAFMFERKGSTAYSC